MSSDELEPAERLTAAMDVWLRHRLERDCSDDQLLSRHTELRDLLEPLIADARGDELGAAPPERHFGSYRLLAEIGRGGVGVVYEAVQTPLGRHIALKLLSDSLQNHPQAVARFRREGGLLARLQHPHIVQVYDAGVQDGVPFHAMERIDGVSLHELLNQLAERTNASCDGDSLATALADALLTAPSDESRSNEIVGAHLRANSHIEAAVRLVHSIAQALVAAHGEGILHRDVKPANILLRRDGTPMLSDFGLARDIREPGLTQSGGFIGTPFYVSPEQASGQSATVDVRSDVFSLAVVLYELLVLSRPFVGETSEEVLAQVRQVEPHQLLKTATGLPADLLAVLEFALQRHREDRYVSMTAFANDLAAILGLRPVQARRRNWLSRSWQAARRRPAQTAVWTSLALSAATALSLWLHLASQQSRIDAGFLKEMLPQVEQHLELAVLEKEGGNYDLASIRVAAAAKLLPDLPLVLVSQAHLHWSSGNRDEARLFIDRIAKVAPDVAAQFTPDAPEPDSSLAWFVRGWQLMERGHRTSAMQDFQDAAKSYRHAIDRSLAPIRLFHCEYLHALTHANDWPAVRAMVDDVGHLWPNSPAVAYWRGFALIATNTMRAAKELERAVEQLPNLSEPRLRLAKVLEQQDAHSSAEQHIRKLLAEHPKLKKPRLILARLLRKQRRAKDALPILEALQTKWTNTFRVSVELAHTLGALGRHKEALVAAEHAVKKAQSSPIPYDLRATVLKRMGRYQEALADANKACDMAPKNYDFLQTRAGLYVRMRKWKDAIDNLRRIVELNPRAKSSWCDLATICRRNQDLPGATAALAKAEAIDPHYWLLHLQRAHLLQAQKQPDDAREQFQLAADANPKRAEAVINLAGFFMSSREYDQGLELLAEARRRQPELWHGWRPAIATLTSLGRHKEAEGLLARWCQSHSKDATRWKQLATLRRTSPEHTEEQAQQALAHVTSLLGDDNAFVLAERGELLLQSGDNAGARSLFERVVTMKRVSEKVRKACRDRLAQTPR